MSPFYFIVGSSASVFFVHGGTGYVPGSLTNVSSEGGPYGVRPAISLKSCVTVTGGNGSVASPYTVSIDNTCALQDE